MHYLAAAIKTDIKLLQPFAAWMPLSYNEAQSGALVTWCVLQVEFGNTGSGHLWRRDLLGDGVKKQERESYKAGKLLESQRNMLVEGWIQWTVKKKGYATRPLIQAPTNPAAITEKEEVSRRSRQQHKQRREWSRRFAEESHDGGHDCCTRIATEGTLINICDPSVKKRRASEEPTMDGAGYQCVPTKRPSIGGQ
jgi:hypothetical protein